MANTQVLKTSVEQFVRKWLAEKYKTSFEDNETSIKLLTGGKHRFDAVSIDASIIAGIKANMERDPTSKRRIGTGTVKSAFTELYFLSLTKAKKKLLVLTDHGFFDIMKRMTEGKIWPDMELIYCPLPRDLSAMVADINATCRGEIGKIKQQEKN